MATIIITAAISAIVAISAYILVQNTLLKKKREQARKAAEQEGENIKKEKIFQAKELWKKVA